MDLFGKSFIPFLWSPQKLQDIEKHQRSARSRPLSICLTPMTKAHSTVPSVHVKTDVHFQ